MKICHISDSHGAKHHTKLEIPECDILIHSGDIGGRTNILELNEFLIWFEQQPAKEKIWIAGNHDLIMDKEFPQKERGRGNMYGYHRMNQEHQDALKLMENFKTKYLNGTDYVYEGCKFYGSPYSPWFHGDFWAFNADRGESIQKQWAKIPSDVDVLITHGPVYGILDHVEDKYREAAGEDMNVGDEDLLAVIKKRLLKLKLHCSGHIHDQYGTVLQSVSNTRRVLFSNGAVLTNQYELIVRKPLIINL